MILCCQCQAPAQLGVSLHGTLVHYCMACAARHAKTGRRLGEVTPRYRRLLCAVGWHGLERVSHSTIFGDYLRCKYCGTEDFASEWLKWKRK